MTEKERACLERWANGGPSPTQKACAAALNDFEKYEFEIRKLTNEIKKLQEKIEEAQND